MKQSIKQLGKNMPRLWMVGIIVMLAYLVLSFIFTMFIRSTENAFSPTVDFNYNKIYEVKINWKADLTNDKSYFQLRREQLKNEMQRLNYVVEASYAANSVLDDPNYYALTREVGIIGVEENFMTTLDPEIKKGRDFVKADLDHHLPAIIITEAAAHAFGISTIGDDVLFPIEFNQEKTDYRVVGIVEDLDHQFWLKTNYLAFVYVNRNNTNLSVNSQADWLYLQTNQSFSKPEIEEKLQQIIKNENYDQQLIEFEIRTFSSVTKAKLYSKLKEFKPLLAIMLLLIIYISTTLFGVFHKHVQKKKEEFAIRRALGCHKSGIYKKIFMEAILMAIPGILLAGLLYLNFLFLQNQMENWLASILPALIILLVIILSVAWPAYRAGSIHPVVGLREA
ncbi:MAG: ABC transporter permease [Candidatus Cyclobacteriaceae bacterium M3_2C_046]